MLRAGPNAILRDLHLAQRKIKTYTREMIYLKVEIRSSCGTKEKSDYTEK